jgi:hypothetical protein
VRSSPFADMGVSEKIGGSSDEEAGSTSDGSVRLTAKTDAIRVIRWVADLLIPKYLYHHRHYY